MRRKPHHPRRTQIRPPGMCSTTIGRHAWTGSRVTRCFSRSRKPRTCASVARIYPLVSSGPPRGGSGDQRVGAAQPVRRRAERRLRTGSHGARPASTGLLHAGRRAVRAGGRCPTTTRIRSGSTRGRSATFNGPLAISDGSGTSSGIRRPATSAGGGSRRAGGDPPGCCAGWWRIWRRSIGSARNDGNNGNVEGMKNKGLLPLLPKFLLRSRPRAREQDGERGGRMTEQEERDAPALECRPTGEVLTAAPLECRPVPPALPAEEEGDRMADGAKIRGLPDGALESDGRQRSASR